MKGIFVTFEGIDGCGKSTQVEQAAMDLELKSIPHIVTREPGGTPIGEKIRSILLSPENKEMCNPCEVLLYLASRAQHMHEKIQPALEAGKVVLCDRFMEATLAYQGAGRGISLDLLVQMNLFSTAGIVPTVTFVFDIDVETSVQRLQKTGKMPDRLESSGDVFFGKVRQGYLDLAKKWPDRIVVLSGDKPIEELSRVVVQKITALLS
jgi:dTMP kinase